MIHLCIGSSVHPSINFSPAMAPSDEAREISSAPAGAVVDENSNGSTNFHQREKRLPLAELDNRIVLPKRRGALQRFVGIGPTEDLESSMPPSRWTCCLCQDYQTNAHVQETEHYIFF